MKKQFLDFLYSIKHEYEIKLKDVTRRSQGTTENSKAGREYSQLIHAEKRNAEIDFENANQMIEKYISIHKDICDK